LGVFGVKWHYKVEKIHGIAELSRKNLRKRNAMAAK